MDAANVILAAIGLLAAIAVPVAIHRAAHPKRRVSYHLAQRPASPIPASPGVVPTRFEVPPGWPMIVTVTLWSSGRADISSKAFDSKQPIVFQFSSPILEDGAPVQDPTGFGGFEREGTNRLVIRPSRLGRDTVHWKEVVVASPVEYLVRHSLVDVEVAESRVTPHRQGAGPGAPNLLRSGAFWGVLQIVLSFALIIMTVALDSSGAFAWVTVIGSLLLFTGMLTLIVVGLVRFSQWIAARAKSRRAGELRPTAPADSGAK